MFNFQRIVLVFSLLCWSLLANASNALPHEIIETSIKHLLSEFDMKRAELEADNEKLFQLVEDIVVPQIDVPIVSRLVLAKHWRTASEEQRLGFTEQFKVLLIRTYATALFKYTGKEEMIVSPAKFKPEDRKARVKTEVQLPGSSPIEVNYSLLKNQDGQWKIYDVTIDGISLVKNYRVAYGEAVTAKGLDVLISEMKAKNSQPAASE